MASEWPFGYEPREQFWVWAGHHEPEYDSGRGKDEPYLHRDAARAWQAFRDFLNGVGEQGDMSLWQKKVDDSWDFGYRMGKLA